jgi:hypothetical protein
MKCNGAKTSIVAALLYYSCSWLGFYIYIFASRGYVKSGSTIIYHTENAPLYFALMGALCITEAILLSVCILGAHELINRKRRLEVLTRRLRSPEPRYSHRTSERRSDKPGQGDGMA